MLKEDWKYVRTPSPYILISISKMKRPRNTNSLMSESIEQTQKYHQNVFLKEKNHQASNEKNKHTQISSWKNKLPNYISPTFPPSHPLVKQSEFWWILVITQNPFSLHYPSYPLHNIQNWVGFFQIVTTLLFPHSDLLALITTWTILIAHFHHSDFHLHNLGFSSCTHSQT